MLDTCPVISGQNILSPSILGSSKNKERYKVALTNHLKNLYDSAHLVNGSEYPKNQSELSDKILRPVEATLVDLPLTTAEKKVKDYLDRAPHDVTVADVVRQFAKVPYGWADCCSIYVVNELVRRHLYAFNYNNNPNVSREDTARNIVRDANRFTIEPAKAISQDILNDSALNRLLSNYRKLSRKINGCPFESVIDKAITLMEKWTNIRDHKEFFTTITEAKESAAALFDRCKNINTFVNDQFEGYQKIKLFIQENRDNFAFLPEDQKEAQNRLCDIHDDMEPWENMPAYLKMMRNLNGRLEECKAALIETIKTNYNKAFDELEEYAASMKVGRDKFAKRDITISQKINTSNFYALQANAVIAGFYEEQMRKINEAVPKSVDPKPYTPIAEGGEGVVKEPTTTPRARKMVHLHTHSTQPIQTEADIDRYLQRLKAELMQHIGGDYDIIIS